MNYILIMTEGTTELAFLDVLLEKNLLKFKKEELLMEQIYHKRQIDSVIKGYIQLLTNQDKVTIYRVGDALKDKLKIPSTIISTKIDQIIDVSTTPEFEVLFLLKEDLYTEFLKVKSTTKASSFYKQYKKRYNKQYDYVFTYFSNMSDVEIINLIALYIKKHGKALKKNQKTLIELIQHN